jgi:hypothetical protein
MPIRFEQFRVSLILRDQKDLFQEETRPNPLGYLRTVFSEPRRFIYRKIAFQYLPDQTRLASQYIFGGIGRERMAPEDVPTAAGFVEATHKGWKASLLVLDPANGGDGQKLAMEVDLQVGSPASLLTALAGAINEANASALYTIEVQPIFDGRSFWQFAEEHRGNITELTLDLVAPNGFWNASRTVKEEMRELNRRLKAQRVVNTVKSDEGINTDDEGVHEAVEYAESGSGAVRARSREGRRYNSKSKTRTSYLDDADNPGETLVVRAELSIRRVLDRE